MCYKNLRSQTDGRVHSKKAEVWAMLSDLHRLNPMWTSVLPYRETEGDFRLLLCESDHQSWGRTLYLPLSSRETLINVLERWRQTDTSALSDCVRIDLAKCLTILVDMEINLKSNFFFLNCNRGKTYQSF